MKPIEVLIYRRLLGGDGFCQVPTKALMVITDYDVLPRATVVQPGDMPPVYPSRSRETLYIVAKPKLIEDGTIDIEYETYTERELTHEYSFSRK